MDVVWAVVALVTCVVCIGLLLWVSASGHEDRDAEEAARDFFDEHGHWPDEDPSAARPAPGSGTAA